MTSGALACVGNIDPGATPSENGAPGGMNAPAGPGGGAPTPGTGTTPNHGNGSPTPGTGTTPAPTPGAGGQCAPAPGRIWPLTPQQYMRTVRAVLPTASAGLGAELEGTTHQGTGFSNEAGRLGLTEPHVSEMLDTVWKVASKATENLAQLSPCLATATPEQACIDGFVAQFGARAFRRELTTAEVGEMAGYLRGQSTGGDLKAGVRRFLLYVLTSPHFVFRSELGAEGAAGPVKLTGFERAQSLSYFLTDGPPDAELFAAAKSGALDTPAGIEAHTKRLLTKREDGAGYVKLFRELFQTAAPRTTDKDGEVFADWKAPLAADLARASEAFVDQVLFAEDGKLSTLLTADFSMMNGALATFYGAGAGGADFSKVKHKAGERAGILTQAGAMATLAKNNDTDPVARGLFVREMLLCQHVPPVPMNLNAVPPPPDGKRTGRERLAQHSSDPTCAGCHSQMDPLGLAFEIYDGIGRHRTLDVGQKIDASGTLTGADPEGARFTDAVELMKLLAASPTVGRCMVSTAFRYAHGREATAADRCTIDRLAARFASSGGNLLDLAVAITTDDSFFVRQARP